MRMLQLWDSGVEEYVSWLGWSPCGRYLAACPSVGEIWVWNGAGEEVAVLPGDPIGNNEPAWGKGVLVTCGLSGRAACHSIPQGTPWKASPGRGPASAAKWSADGSHLAFVQGGGVHVFDAAGSLIESITGHRGGVSDVAWNPIASHELASVGAGGACMWRLGESEPFARVDWGGASLLARWSADGRWLATADQTPSIHLYDFGRDYPLHIQGYPIRVGCLEFSDDALRLATAAGSVVTIWNCEGEQGPEGSTPKQLGFHGEPVRCLGYRPASHTLATGDDAGRLAISDASGLPVAAFDDNAAISAVAWNSAGTMLAVGTAEGMVALFRCA